MHDKFEKEVQRKMEELQLTPSAPVWQKIQLEITPEKKRRRLILWFFVGAFLLATGLFVFQPWQKDFQEAAVQQAPVETKQFDKEPALPNENSNNVPAETETNVPNGNETQGLPLEQKIVTPNKSTYTVFYDRRKHVQVKKPVSSKNQAVVVQKSETDLPTGIESSIVVTEKQTPPAETDQPVKAKTALTKQETIGSDSTKPKAGVNKQDSVAKPQPAKTEISQPIIDSSVKKKAAANTPWRKRINFSVGKTGYTSIASTKSATYDQQYQSPGPSAPPQLGNAVQRPAETKSGLGFSVGISFGKKLSKNLELAIGAQYAYSSTKTTVGAQRRRDTTVVYNSTSMSTARYYTNSQAENYTNHFHAIELPVSLSYQPSLGLPIYISAGAAYGRLLSTNALTYSPNANVYYENKDNYLRNSLPIFSSVQIGLFEKKKVSVRIGPAIQYNLLKVQKERSNSASHLFFAGIKGGINF